MRRCEICALKYSDIDLAAERYTLMRAAKIVDGKVVIGKLKTKSSTRKGRLPAFVIPILKEHRRTQRERHMLLGLGNIGAETFVFERQDGTCWNPNELSRRFSRFVRRHRLSPMRFHDLRHAHASLRNSSGSSLKEISESLGHSSIGITANLYVHLLEDSKSADAERFDDYLHGAIRSLRGDAGNV